MEKNLDNLPPDDALSEPHFDTQAGVRAERVVPLVDRAEAETATVVSQNRRSDALPSSTKNSSWIKNFPLVALSVVALVAGIAAALMFSNSNRKPTAIDSQAEAVASQERQPIEKNIQAEQASSSAQKPQSREVDSAQPKIQRQAEIRNLPDSDFVEDKEDDKNEREKDFEKEREKDREKDRKEQEKRLEKARKEMEKSFEKERKDWEKKFKNEGGGDDKKGEKHKDKKGDHK